jgi:hypothetical protein
LRPDRSVDKLFQDLDSKKRSHLASKSATVKDSGELKSIEEELNEKSDEVIKVILKKYIKSNLGFYKKQKLNKAQSIALKYIDLNPHTAIILDDVAALIGGATKKDLKILIEIYFQGRNQNLTTFITSQSDTAMNKQLRDNAHISVYTDPSTTSTSFQSSRNLPKSITVPVQKLLSTDSNFFDRSTTQKVYRMLILFRMLGNVLAYVISKRVPTIKYGSTKYWELAERIEKSALEKEQQNPYLKRFMSKLETDERASKYKDSGFLS